MYKKITHLCALVLSLFIFFSPTALAGHCECAKIHHKVHDVVQQLDLTGEQKDKINSIMEKTHEALKAKHDEMHDLTILVNTAYKDGIMTEPKIDEFAHKKMQIFGAAIKIHMMERFEISKVLTNEQKEKLNAMLQNWMDEHMKEGSKSCHAMHH